jgi:hypothetical protein
VECEFIVGSDADGCVVVLVSSGEVDNTTLNSTREGNSSRIAMTQHELPSPLHCYYRAYALDIESDGSVGILPVPGVLDLADTNTVESCLPTDIPQTQSEYAAVEGPPMHTYILIVLHTLYTYAKTIYAIKFPSLMVGGTI